MWYNSPTMSLGEILHSLQEQRGGVETFVLIDGIGPRAVINARRALKDKTGDEIDVILHSPGGSPDDAYRLIRSFREHYQRVNVIVPFWAKSAATLFALGATRIVMQEYGELGPIDAQIRKDDEEKPGEEWESALNIQASLLKIEELSNRNFVDLFTNLQHNSDINIGRKQLAEMLLSYNSELYALLLQRVEVYEMGRMERYLSIGKMYANRIIKQYGSTDPVDAAKIEEFLDFITYECPDHGYVLDYSVLKDFLPNVIRSSESPYGEDYDKILEELSYILMNDTEGIAFVGFVSEIPKATPTKKTKKPQAAKIEEKEQPQDDTSRDKHNEPQDQRPGSEPKEDNRTQKPKSSK